MQGPGVPSLDQLTVFLTVEAGSFRGGGPSARARYVCGQLRDGQSRAAARRSRMDRNDGWSRVLASAAGQYSNVMSISCKSRPPASTLRMFATISVTS